MGRSVLRRPVGCARRAEQVDTLRLGVGAVRRRRVKGARAGAFSGGAAHRGATRRSAGGPGQPRLRRRRRQLRTAGDRRGRARSAGARPDRPRRRGSRRTTAGRSVTKRSGGHAVSTLAARRDQTRRRRSARRRLRTGDAGCVASDRDHARQDASTVRAADPAGTPPAGARASAAARRRPAGRFRQASRGVALRIRGTGGVVAEPGPRRDRRRTGIRRRSGQLGRRHRVTRLRRRGGVRVLDDRGRSVPTGRGHHPLEHNRIRLCDAARLVVDGKLDHAAEEEPRHRRIGARQIGPADRQSHRPAGDAEGAAAGVQPGPAGGQGAGVRLRPSARAAAACHGGPGRDAAFRRRPDGRAGPARLHPGHRRRRMVGAEGSVVPGGARGRGRRSTRCGGPRRRPRGSRGRRARVDPPRADAPGA